MVFFGNSCCLETIIKIPCAKESSFQSAPQEQVEEFEMGGKGPAMRFCGLFVNSLSSEGGGGAQRLFSGKFFVFFFSKVLCCTSKNSCYNHLQISSLLFLLFLGFLFSPLSPNYEYWVGEEAGEKSETIKYEDIRTGHNPSAPNRLHSRLSSFVKIFKSASSRSNPMSFQLVVIQLQ